MRPEAWLAAGGLEHAYCKGSTYRHTVGFWGAGGHTGEDIGNRAEPCV